MQFIIVVEGFSQDFGCDYILVIDFGGLIGGVLILVGDRFELEVFLVILFMGLSNVIVISLVEIKDILVVILYVFLRLEKMGYMFNYQFVYQNFYDVFVFGFRLRDKRQFLDLFGDLSRVVVQMEKQSDGFWVLVGLVFCDFEKQYIWYIFGLWYGVFFMVVVSLVYSEVIFELKRCLFENIRNGLLN